MNCTPVRVGDGDDEVVAIVCTGRGKRPITCSAIRDDGHRCARFGDRLCDWKNPNGTTCDAGLCDDHTHQPARGKDLCPDHAHAWLNHPANKQLDLAL